MRGGARAGAADPAAGAWLATPPGGGVLTAQVAVLTASYGLAPLAAWLLLRLCARVEGVSWRSYLGPASGRRAVAVLITTALPVAAVTAAASWGAWWSGLDAGRPVLGGAGGLPLLLVLFYGLARAFVLQGIQEEWWFRGFAFVDVRRHPWFTLAATTVAFTVLHLTSSGGQQSGAERVLYLALPLGMGLWAGVERWCSGTVWAAVGVHGGIHTGLLVPALLGWPQGPASWVVLGVTLTVAAALRLALARP
ncbi:CPBP family intramembrane metalloprotease [Propioniciclava coleopterorum]|uniref:CPBP family intramembrane metalloprotease n=1 Tax=Propioniciclava coleopterorum TaxID=2714937 RepID=A0A6G7Y7D3_9ACTN|nr:CPBP family intramembrane glutamic endopeptidase [Propioniciclava coleopterorum]QIK72527.1 CPBP family intramembrane metalloprotease [Propioniciclava coleopterorum]